MSLPEIPVKPVHADGITYYMHPHPRSPFSEAVQVGCVLYLSAMIGLDAQGRLVDGFEPQVRQIMSNSQAILRRYGLGLEHVFKTTVMMKDMANWSAFNRLYKPYFHPTRLPVRTAFGVSDLAYGAEVELEFQAYVPHGG
ncbi:RidA family protein [Asticcacaulis excentricus]|uniref:Endoribonuclease L-PSP n=1 Tax=Asticcacaulis excentricus (strain ATCC 15261 / DSM 4724 / KCTC 12464 / NCIMB 9791 / VKM B-1370 / CB 48) TaxID=573065 RepID=E8RTI9_ASTEC|nr:RidA family protein [Asticcacaulis excentricus]ADU14810.1 Endoribonuclease L-PSP [Asticcacaulis excentricus CB 48]